MRMSDIKIPAVERVKAEADQAAQESQAGAFSMVWARLLRQAILAGSRAQPQPPEIDAPTRFFRRMAGLRGADLRRER